jgi:hypothetical protein
MAIDFSRSYTFSEYFDLQIPADELIRDLGYHYRREQIQPRLPVVEVGFDVSTVLNVMKRTRTVNESTKRETIVSPIVQAIVLETDTELRIEYPISVTPQLRGSLDYLVSKENFAELLVIEAKRNDLDYGFTQLAAQLICLDQWERSPELEVQPVLTGAVTTGDIWKFGQLQRHLKQITEGLNSYSIPDDVQSIFALLRQGLSGLTEVESSSLEKR